MKQCCGNCELYRFGECIFMPKEATPDWMRDMLMAFTHNPEPTDGEQCRVFVVKEALRACTNNKEDL